MSQRLDYNAASPAGAKALGAVHAYVHQSGLPARLVNLVYLRVSHINGCAYCIDMAFAGPSQERAIRRTPRSRGRLA
jgi:alkylhydroperoxidase family enzyme